MTLESDAISSEEDLKTGSKKMADNFRVLIGFDLSSVGRKAQDSDKVVLNLMVAQTGRLLLAPLTTCGQRMPRRQRRRRSTQK